MTRKIVAFGGKFTDFRAMLAAIWNGGVYETTGVVSVVDVPGLRSYPMGRWF